MTFHFHITRNEIETGLHVVSHLAGNSVLGNTASALSHGIDTFEDIEHHNTMGAIVDGAETLVSTGEAVIDGVSGNWL
jgi:hypothetical protein